MSGLGLPRVSSATLCGQFLREVNEWVGSYLLQTQPPTAPAGAIIEVDRNRPRYLPSHVSGRSASVCSRYSLWTNIVTWQKKAALAAARIGSPDSIPDRSGLETVFLRPCGRRLNTDPLSPVEN
jgi:hypothetical protein